MDPIIQHDPRTKQRIKDALYAHLYEPVRRSFQKRLTDIIRQNSVHLHSLHRSFTYKGVQYSLDTTPAPRRANRLVPAMVPSMAAYLHDLQVLNDQEIPYVMGYINQVLNASNDLCDYLELFPSSMHHPIQEFINACPCKTHHLSAEEVEKIQQRNAESIALIKNRMALNLLI